ncbi:MAG: hypothetical protein BLM47_03165 [Candidatus Reconcilbacillus cellulovorans]|uniref:ABC transporter domain-containing protein n=1 Tax=Candidatus Reconcilbacillus cellulovorans TaxID=1906605 RepID=A0A2A6E314_9BACL|nr:MAG: hypothetical protein BLM47_03165 [Candidatus Reconcilbacillus cellulovorans]
MLEVRHLCFAYESGRMILNGASFVAHPGDLIWLQGTNGSGKTTLLRILARLLEAEGELALHVGGRAIRERSKWLEYVAFSPAEPYLFEYLTGAENVEFLRSLFAIPAESFAKRFRVWTKRFGLEEALNRPVQEYSLGMRHQLYWAVLAARDAAVYLLDEPFSALDDRSREHCKAWMQEASQNGKIVVLVTHVAEFGMTATRTLRLVEGKIEELRANGKDESPWGSSNEPSA